MLSKTVIWSQIFLSLLVRLVGQLLWATGVVEESKEELAEEDPTKVVQLAAKTLLVTLATGAASPSGTSLRIQGNTN